ncbi:MAG: hypothetical protein EA380_05090 [Phycisphaeraceae bacterium]|nr:MAG: hypothetical protein EA380_05090 [Phycisphaeraceae bacterium]
MIPSNPVPSTPPRTPATPVYHIHQHLDLRLAPFQEPTIVGASFLDTRVARAFRRPAAVILALPGAGRAWLGAILAHAFADLLPNKTADFPAKPLDIDSWTTIDPRLPRIVATNGKVNPWKSTPEQMPRAFPWLAKVPVIVLTRDPRDIATTIIARRYALRPASEGASSSHELESLIDTEHAGLATLAATQHHWIAATHTFGSSHIVTYEHLHADPHLEIGRLLNFLHMEATAQRVAGIAHASRFEALRDAENQGRLGLRLPTDPNKRLLRRGITGGFRDYLSSSALAQAQRVIARHAPEYA